MYLNRPVVEVVHVDFTHIELFHETGLVDILKATVQLHSTAGSHVVRIGLAF